MIGLNVGSGQRPFDQSKGWINIDCVEREGMPKPDLIADGKNIPCKDNYADYVVLHHVLEHFGCGEGIDLIKEAHRVLKPGGSLIVCVPDMAALNHGWFVGKINTQIYMTCVYGAYMGSEEDRHKWGYCGGSLLDFISCSAAWSNSTHFDWRTIPGADIAKDWWILGVEAIK